MTLWDYCHHGAGGIRRKLLATLMSVAAYVPGLIPKCFCIHKVTAEWQEVVSAAKKGEMNIFVLPLLFF